MHIVFIDVFIVFLVVGAMLRGFQIGFTRQFFSTTGFLLGLYPGTLLSSFIMRQVAGPAKPLVGLASLLLVCFALMTVGEIAALRIKYGVKNKYIQAIDNAFGSAMSTTTLLLGIWLTGSLLTLAPTNPFQNQLNESRIFGSLNQTMPPATRILSALNTLIDPNQSPQVFAGREPSPEASYPLPSPTNYTAMLEAVKPSVVKIEGLGCGGIIDGSGFVFAPERVVTNAHVIAGVKNPKVTDQDGTYGTSVVLFDPSNDIAVLKVPKLARQPLQLEPNLIEAGTVSFALGYPKGGTYTVAPTVVLNHFLALGQDIYGRQRTTRSVYGLQGSIITGNSGGPVVNTEGKVIGVVFATSTSYNNIGYALTIKQVDSLLTQARTATKPVPNGHCSL
ncbi:MAG: MarP family serine protease [Candidatus Saccharimonadales bacterium]